MKLEDVNKLLLSKEVYDPMIKELLEFQLSRIEMVNEYNKIESSLEGLELRKKQLKKMFRTFNDGYIEPPFHANFGGLNVDFGNNAYANFNLTLVDDGEITIGDNTLIGPNVTIITPIHPESPSAREKGLQYNLPVNIGKNVWIASNVTIFPGVTIGDNSIIGAGSLVTKDIPENVLAYGTPAKVIRKIKEDK